MLYLVYYNKFITISVKWCNCFIVRHQHWSSSSALFVQVSEVYSDKRFLSQQILYPSSVVKRGSSWWISTLLQKLIGWKTASLYKSPLISISNFLGFKYVYLWLRKNYVDFIRGKSIYFFLHFLCYFETFERTRSQQGFLGFF